jgi:hypothetical protein
LINEGETETNEGLGEEGSLGEGEEGGEVYGEEGEYTEDVGYIEE